MQMLIDGLARGLPFALLATGFATAYMSSRVLCVAMGGIYALTPYLFLSVREAGFHWTLAALGAIIAGMLLGAAMEAFNHWPLSKRSSSSEAHFLSSLGIYVVIAHGISLVWGAESLSISKDMPRIYSLGGASLTPAKSLAIVAALVILIAYLTWISRTQLGTLFRALADNPRELSLRGFSLRRLRLAAFGVAGFMCATSSLLVANDRNAFDPNGGLDVVLKAILVSIVGGLRSFFGPALAAFALSLLSTWAVVQFSSKWGETCVFLLFALLLFFKPGGIFAHGSRVEAGAG